MGSPQEDEADELTADLFMVLPVDDMRIQATPFMADTIRQAAICTFFAQ